MGKRSSNNQNDSFAHNHNDNSYEDDTFNEQDQNNSILAAGDEVIIASSNVPMNSYRVVKPVGHNLKASLQPLIIDSSGNSFEDVKVTPQHRGNNLRKN